MRVIRKHEQAIEFYFVALKKVETKEGRVKFLILQSIGEIYPQLGQHEKSLENFKYAMAGREQILGPEHEETLHTISWVGGTFHELHQHRASFEFFRKALAGREKTLGLEHKHTLFSLYIIGCVYDKLGQYTKSLDFFHEALAGRERTLGRNTKILCCAFIILVGSITISANIPRAWSSYTNPSPAVRKHLGQNIQSLCIQSTICGVYEDLNQYQDSLELRKKASIAQEKTLGAGHEDILHTASF
ncbi:unnamed protein product [Penicillium discolor]